MQKIFFRKCCDYYGKELFQYAVLDLKENSSGILYIYKETKKRYELKKPQTFYLVDLSIGKNCIDILNHNIYYSHSSKKFVEINSTVEEENLYVPKEYKREQIRFEYVADNDISDEMLEKIKQLDFINPVIIIGEDLNKKNKTKETDYCFHRYSTYECYCTNCKKTFFAGKNNSYYIECPTCSSSKTPILVMEDFKKHVASEYDKNYLDYPIQKKEPFYYMLSKENGIILYKINREIIAKKNTVKEQFSIEYSIEHIIGQRIVTYKHLKKGKKECDAFEALNLNSKNIMSSPNILYEDADNFFEFAQNNEKFLKMSGFQSVLKYSTEKLKLEPFFILFLAIMNKYPIMEQIVKMGHAQIFWHLYQDIINSTSANEINDKVEKISQIVNNEATKGKEALRFPSYIGDYLIRKNANLEEYYYWRDLYEISNISKEQFENFIDSFNFAWVNSQVGFEDIGNILKFGYPVDKLFSYIVKQSKKENIRINDLIQMMSDYLNMCDFCEIEPDKYPQEVKKQHDDMLIYFRKQKNAEYDSKLTLIGAECEKYVIPNEDELDNIGIPKLFKTLTVVFPRYEADFINEGNQQHNCVGSYPRRVKNGSCIIFFIRNKETPDKSFITAECTQNGLGQCFYSNNRYVSDENLIKFAKYIANKIKKGCESKQIHGLNNI